MEYWNAPLGTVWYPGIAAANPSTFPRPEEGANGGGSPGFYLNNPGCVATIAWASTQATQAGQFFVYSQRNSNDRWNAVATGGAGGNRLASKNAPFDIQYTGNSLVTELQGGGVNGRYYTHRVESSGDPRKALVMETANEPVEFTHVSCVDGEVRGALTAVPSAGENVFIAYRAGSSGTVTYIQATLGGSWTTCNSNACFSAFIPNAANTEYYVFTSTCSLANVQAYPELCWLRHYGRDRRGVREVGGGTENTCNWMLNYSVRPTINPVCVTQGGATITFDGQRDAVYARLTERDHTSPLASELTATDVGDPETLNSDFSAESAATIFYTGTDHNAPDYLNDINSGCSGTWANISNLPCTTANSTATAYKGQANIRQFDISWDNTYLYILVTGPNAYFEHDGGMQDVMDMFVAIDTDGAVDADPRSPTTKVPRTEAPFNKKVDFAGWSPEYWVAVERINQSAVGSGNSATYAGLYQRNVGAAPTEVVLDVDATAEAACPSFEIKGSYNGDPANSFTEIRIPWSRIGDKPNEMTGKRMNFACYTTYDENDYDTYDSGPGYGQGHGRPFEQIGDSPWDADHGGGHLDPVTGTNDANFYIFHRSGATGFAESINADPYDSRVPDQGPGDNNSGSSNGRQPASDRTGNEDDTVELYWSVSNVGQINAKFECADVPADALNVVACPAAFPAAYTAGSTTGITNINALPFFQNGGAYTYTDGGGCYNPTITVTVVETPTVTCTELEGSCAGQVTEIARTYTVNHTNHRQEGVAACSIPPTQTLSTSCGAQTLSKSGECRAACTYLYADAGDVTPQLTASTSDAPCTYEIAVNVDVAGLANPSDYFAIIDGKMYGPYTYNGGANPQMITISDPSFIADGETAIPLGMGSVVINEVHASVASGLDGDANGDGTRDASADEFVEIVNNSCVAVDISGWEITGFTPSNFFPVGTILNPGQAAIIFGPGQTPNPNIALNTGALVFTKSSTTGTGLTDTGELLTLKDACGKTIQEVNYGSSSGMSRTRNPDLTGAFVGHTSIAPPGLRYSPGTDNTGANFDNSATCATCATPTFDEPACAACDYSAASATATLTASPSDCCQYDVSVDVNVDGLANGDTFFAFINGETYGPFTYGGTSPQTVTISGASLMADGETGLQVGFGGVVINEIHAAPTTDTNGDGTIDNGDEFVEIVNTSCVAVDISGWSINGFTTGTTASFFPSGTILAPGQAALIFSNDATALGAFGGALVFSGATGATGTLDSGETLTLQTECAATINTVNYVGMGSNITRVPDGNGDVFQTHICATGTAASPGTMSDGTAFAAPAYCTTCPPPTFDEPTCTFTAPDLIISEIQTDPGSGDASGGEWIELLCKTGPCAIEGLYVTNGEFLIQIPLGTPALTTGEHYTIGSNLAANMTGAVGSDLLNHDLTANGTYSHDLDLMAAAAANCTTGGWEGILQCASGTTISDITLDNGAEQLAVFSPCNMSDPIAAMVWGAGENLPISKTVPTACGGTPCGSPTVTVNFPTSSDPSASTFYVNDGVTAIIPTVPGGAPNETGCTTSYAWRDGAWVLDDTPTPGLVNSALAYTLTINGQDFDIGALSQLEQEEAAIVAALGGEIRMCVGEQLSVSFTQIDHQTLAPTLPNLISGIGATGPEMPAGFGSGISFGNPNIQGENTLAAGLTQTITAAHNNQQLFIRITELGYELSVGGGNGIAYNNDCSAFGTAETGMSNDCIIELEIPVKVSVPNMMLTANCTDNSGTMEASATGGFGPYTFEGALVGGGGDFSKLTSGADTIVATQLVQGDYAVTVTDAQGCTFEQTISVDLPCALPVELLSFNAKLASRRVLLTWATASEQHSAYFLVERSLDGTRFTPIGKVDAAGNSTDLRNYSFDDAAIDMKKARYYYRLKMVDKDGSYEYSPLRSVTVNGKTPIMDVRPNPTNGEVVVTAHNFSGKVLVQVYNTLGALLRTERLDSGNSLSLDLVGNPEGVYFIQATDGEQSIVRKVILE
jgi:hypothetical protein